MILNQFIKKNKIPLLAILFLCQFTTSVYSSDQEYILANTNGNFESVQRLFESCGAKEKQMRLQEMSKTTLYSEDMNYIHEPYWSYNVVQLRDYGKRIIEKIRPCFIDKASIDETRGEVDVNGKKIRVRKVNEFGRILPLLYLKDQLERENSQDKAVPRIFIIPNKDHGVTFEFSMPYLEKNHRYLSLTSGSNFLTVESDDFTLYQEFIEGSGNIGDSSFVYYGHTDLNAKQIIVNSGDGKKYLIDTKESKNFYFPPLNPNADCFFAYWTMKMGRVLPQNCDEFIQWQERQQRLMLTAKTLHYPLELKAIKVSIGEIDDQSPKNLAANSYGFMFDDLGESEAYFEKPTDNLARYLKIGRYDLFLKVISKDLNASLDGVLIPQLFQNQETLIELVVDLLRPTLFNKNEKDRIILCQILESLISRVDSTVEKEQKALLNLIAPRITSEYETGLPFEQGVDLFTRMLKKRKADSAAVLEATILKGEMSLLEIVLSHFSDKKIIEDSLGKIISPSEVKEFKDLTQEYRLQLIKSLLSQLPAVSTQTVDSLFLFYDKGVIDGLFEKRLDLGHALCSAVRIVKEPNLSYIRSLMGDHTPVDYYWYSLVERILTANPPATDIDFAISIALQNSKTTLLPILLKRKPADSPRTNELIDNFIVGSYLWDDNFEGAIGSN